MLKSANRLRSQRDFKRTLAGRKICVNDCFAIYGLVSTSSATGPFLASGSASQKLAQPRIGFIVSKKIHKRSVKRNRIRRRLRELFRLWLLSDNKREALSRYHTVVVIARSGSVDAGYRDLENRLERCFRSR